MTSAGEDLAFRSATELAGLVRTREVSPIELVRCYLGRIERFDGQLRAYITVLAETALEVAHKAEAAVMRREPLGPLHGVPYAVKDQFATAGVRTTLGSRLLEQHVPTETATVISRMNEAGGILLGKLNLTEFALGGTQHFPFGQPRNPWNPDHDPGGSRRSYVTPAALAGTPAIAVPCGLTPTGLPISLQLIGRRFDEATLLRAAHAHERDTQWSQHRPPLAS